MRVCLLASGSKGNAVYIETAECRLLVDAGLSGRELLGRLAQIGVDGAGLDAILVSHEHSDHTRGAGTLARRLRIPLLVSYPTFRAIEPQVGKTAVIEFETGYSFAFRDVAIDPFPITHDACDPVGFVFECAHGKIGFATDLGIVTRLVTDKLRGCRTLIVEANHDEEMLLNGPYPWHLKQRIKSRHGHLSNRDTAGLLDAVIHEGLEGVFLAHLSETNNDPEIACQVARNLLAGQNLCEPRLVVGYQHRVSEVLAFGRPG